MTEYRSVLERARDRIPEVEVPLESILHGRDLRQRNRRVAAGAVALALVALVIGGWLAAVVVGRSAPADETPRPADAFEPASIGAVVVSERGCTLAPMVGPVRAGAMELVVVNDGNTPAAVDLVRFEPGELTYGELIAHVEKQRRRAEAGEPAGSGDHEPFGTIGLPRFAGTMLHEEVGRGASEPMRGTIYPGTYAVVCFRVYETGGALRPFAVDGPVRVR